ncbi:sodium:proton antiporter [soil metagenome]
MLELFAIFITVSSVLGFINHKWLKFPTTIGVMFISVIMGVILKIIEAFEPSYVEPITEFLRNFDFSTFVLDFILCFLLFAGSLHVDISQLKGARATVFSYATLGVIISTVLIGLAFNFIVHLFGYEINPIIGFLFGALISPTDPIAVLGILSKYKIPQKLKTEIIGESLFNDGVGVVVFAVIFSILKGGDESYTVSHIAKIFATEVFGGVGIGLLIGYLGYLMMKNIDHYQTEIMITLSVVTGGYALASHLHASGPLAMVVAGLLIGSKGKKHAMSDITAEYVDKFWELIDEICNTILFILMGLEIFLVAFSSSYILIGVLLIVVTLAARYISLLPAFFIFNRKEKDRNLNLAVLTWGGLRGGISIALALSLTNKVEGSNLVIVCTYCIVLFSILVQGLSIKKLLSKY